MDDTSMAFTIGISCLALITLLAIIREVLLKKERDEWARKFERRNRSNYDDRGI